MNLDNNLFIKAYQYLIQANRVLIVGHTNPDSDAISSVAVFIELCLKLNKDYVAFCDNKSRDSFDFLPYSEKVISFKNFDLDSFDLIIIVDCGSLSRTTLEKEIDFNRENRKYKIIEFDHHPKMDDYSDLEIRDPEAASTTEILYYFFKINNLNISKNIATCLLSGILTDTNNFLYSSVKDKTINIASELLNKGAQFSKILEKLNKKNFHSVKIWGKALDNLYINEKYNLAITVLSYDDIKNYQYSIFFEDEIFGEIAGFLSNLSNIKTVLFLREEEPGLIKGSLRATAYSQNINLSNFAQILGGGGHEKASGFKIKGNLLKSENGYWRIK
ncbi:bifunctional oligoribonuclease/PAP phosphatase NrnA [bacterium]|nr:bifunctional oligoribonuclease/PAP phosphatase NrnA [bacterium]